MPSTLTFGAAFLLLVALVHAALPQYRGHPNRPPRPSVPIVTAEDVLRTDVAGTALPPISQVYTFNQLIDHTNPSLGTFTQRYWSTWEWYETGAAISVATFWT